MPINKSNGQNDTTPVQFADIVGDDGGSGWVTPTHAAGPSGTLPFTAEMLVDRPSGDIFGFSQNADMALWYTGKPCARAARSHINFCVYDSSWEGSEAFELDHNPAVDSWVKNDHLGFEVLYVYRCVVRKYRPDFLIRLKSGDRLVLETKGQDDDRNRTKRRFLDEWTRAVNQHGGFGRWTSAVSTDPGDIKDILNTAATNAPGVLSGQVGASAP